MCSILDVVRSLGSGEMDDSMKARLFVAPAGAGKTAHVLAEAREEAHGLTGSPYVLVASALQAQAFRRRLADAGGAIGVRVLTFEALYHTCLNSSGVVYTKMSEAVQHRVIRSVVRELPLVHYAPLTDRLGFVQVLREIIDQLKAARVDPASFAAAVRARADTVRLRELADIFVAYQARLQSEGWADEAGLGWLSVEALENDTSRLISDCSALLVDGFDDFTPVQLTLLALLARRLPRVVITLTGSLDGGEPRLVHRRFDRTRQELVEALGEEPAPLPDGRPHRPTTLNHLEAGLFQSNVSRITQQTGTPDRGTIELMELPNQAQEVRAALRWLKTEVVQHGVNPEQLALLARDITPYRALIRQIAAEFGLPVHIYTGQPLARNPAVAALLDLLQLMLPLGEKGATDTDDGHRSLESERDVPRLPPRLVIEAWRSPYFDWTAPNRAGVAGGEGNGAPVGIEPGDADALGIVARRGRVVEGLDQWEAAFEALSERTAEKAAGGSLEAEDEVEPGVLSGAQVQALHAKFHRFVGRLKPPEGRQAARDFVQWVEGLIGADPATRAQRFRSPEPPSGLNMIARIRALEEGTDAVRPSRGSEALAARRQRGVRSPPAMARRDLTALRGLKRILQGLVWAEEALNEPPIRFVRFVEDLRGAVEAAFYRLPRHADVEQILVADVVAARGLAFRGVAVLGMAEGLFPAAQSEDPLLRDADREQLALSLEPSIRSAEPEYFYETIAAASDKILLTRPQLTDDGAPWQASPFWEEVRRLVDSQPTGASGSLTPPPGRTASWSELIQSICSGPRSENILEWLRRTSPEAVEAVEAAADIVTWRQNRANSPFDGDLRALQDHFASTFDAAHTWSATRLEAYRTCPFHFFVSKVLRLEPREEPTEGIDWLQRGILYHDMLERVYQAVDDPTDLDQLLNALPRIASSVLDDAPARQGFRETAWWAETRKQMIEDVERSLAALAEEQQRGHFVPIRYEAAFGLWGEPALRVGDPAGEDAFELRGLIDRVDRDAEGHLRIIDYKTGGPSSYGSAALRKGDKIQLPLYALAAREALKLGDPVSGFYWHIRHAEASPLKLEDFGPDEAMRTAVAHAWEAIRGARQGRFSPQPPSGGCPAYCPAASFCWHLQRRYTG